MEVEDLLEMEKSEMLSIPDVVEAASHIPDNDELDESFEKPDIEKHEG